MVAKAGWSSSLQRLVKQLIDYVGAFVLLLLISPLWGLIAAAIRWNSPGPVLFRQQRLGHHQRPFIMYKFRSMTHGAPQTLHRDYIAQMMHGTAARPAADGGTHAAATDTTPDTTPDSVTDADPSTRQDGLFKLADDPRITPIGRFLRKTSLDELPQLINVLRGEASLVGPRPVIAYELEHYTPEMFERFDVPPGITGLWQVSGRSSLSYRDMVHLDVEYARTWSLWLDIKILVATVGVVLWGHRWAR